MHTFDGRTCEVVYRMVDCSHSVIHCSSDQNRMWLVMASILRTRKIVNLYRTDMQIGSRVGYFGRLTC